MAGWTGTGGIYPNAAGSYNMQKEAILDASGGTTHSSDFTFSLPAGQYCTLFEGHIAFNITSPTGFNQCLFWFNPGGTLYFMFNIKQSWDFEFRRTIPKYTNAGAAVLHIEWNTTDAADFEVQADFQLAALVL